MCIGTQYTVLRSCTWLHSTQCCAHLHGHTVHSVALIYMATQYKWIILIHLSWRWSQHFPLKRRRTFLRLRTVTFRLTVNSMATTMRTSRLKPLKNQEINMYIWKADTFSHVTEFYVYVKCVVVHFNGFSHLRGTKCVTFLGWSAEVSQVFPNLRQSTVCQHLLKSICR
jgi:hypothetical protein